MTTIQLKHLFDHDVSGVKDWETVTTSPIPSENGKPMWHPVTVTVAMISGMCGFNAITTRNISRVWERVEVWQKFHTPFIVWKGVEILLTRRDLEMHIGMTTTAEPLTAAQFRSKLVKWAADQPPRTNAGGRAAMEIFGWGLPASEEAPG